MPGNIDKFGFGKIGWRGGRGAKEMQFHYSGFNEVMRKGG